MEKVFLGGTCNESTWRNRIITMLKIYYFNPVVDDWTEDCMEREIQERQNCDFCLYVITPKMTGVYSIAEVVDDSNKRPDKTILVLLREDDFQKFRQSQWKSLITVAKMVRANGGQFFDNLKSAAIYMNNYAPAKEHCCDADKFYRHIKRHLDIGQHVICKICDRTFEDIVGKE